MLPCMASFASHRALALHRAHKPLCFRNYNAWLSSLGPPQELVPLILYDDIGAQQYNEEDHYETNDAPVDSADNDPAGSVRGMQSDMVEPAERVPVFVEIHPTAGAIVEIGTPPFAHYRSLLADQAHSLTHPFHSKEEMDLGGWLHESGLSRSKIDEFLRLPFVRCFRFV
jgi:hypothetical protein